MSLDHVYIVLEPIGSARLTFGDNRYYEFMCFDVPKVVQSPGYDHGHDEESRNGQDIKIDILDDYIRTPDELWGSPDNYRSAGGLSEPPGELMGQHGPSETERRGHRAAPLGSPNWTRRGRPLFPSLSPSPSFPLPLPSWTRKR